MKPIPPLLLILAIASGILGVTYALSRWDYATVEHDSRRSQQEQVQIRADWYASCQRVFTLRQCQFIAYKTDDAWKRPVGVEPQ